MQVEKIYQQLSDRMVGHVDALPMFMESPDMIALVYAVNRASGISVSVLPREQAIHDYTKKVFDDFDIFTEVMTDCYGHCNVRLEANSASLSADMHLNGISVVKYCETFETTTHGGSTMVIPTSKKLDHAPIRSLMDELADCDRVGNFYKLMNIINKMNRDKIQVPKVEFHRDLKHLEKYFCDIDVGVQVINKYFCESAVDSALLFSNFSLLFNSMLDRITVQS